MLELNKNELFLVEGGALSIGVIAIVVGALVFLAGVVDGIFRPLKCR